MSKFADMEIERKFLIEGDYKSEAFASSHIVQGYLSRTPGRTVRIRLRDGKGYITIKGPSSPDGISRYEWEKEISPEEARSLLDICEPGTIDKTRWLVRNNDGKHIWEIDEFHGRQEGLVVAEIELGSSDEAFDKPSWLGREVTGQESYYNSRM